MHIGSGRGPDPWEGVKKADQSLVEWQKQHVIEKGNKPTTPQAKQSLLAFHFWGFYYDLNTYLKPLGDYVMSRPSVKRDLFSLNLAPAETLSLIANLANENTSIDTFSFIGKNASIGLKRLADNIRRAKEEGAEAALDQCIYTVTLMQDPDKQKIFKNAKDLLNNLEEKVNALLKEQVEDYESKAASSKVILPESSLVDSLYNFDTIEHNGRFTKAFNVEYFKNLIDPNVPGLSKKAIDKSGETLPLSEVAWSDFESTRFGASVLINKKGEQHLFSDIAKEGKPEGYQPTGRDLLEALRKFCGYKPEEAKDSPHNTAVDEKVFKISRYFCQNLANAYVITNKLSTDRPQQLKYGNPFTVSKKTDLKQFVTLTENEEGFRIEASGKYEGISAVASTADVEIFFTDQSQSSLEYRVGIDLIEGPDGKLVEQEYTEGYLNAKIVLLPPPSPVVPSQAAAPMPLIKASHQEAFSEKFNDDFFDNLKKEEGISPKINIDGKDLPFSKVAWRDLRGGPLYSCALVDKDGKEITLSKMARDIKGKGETDKLTEQDLFDALRVFCGYDPNKEPDSPENKKADEDLFQVSQYLSQNLGNAYDEAARGEHTPQMLNGQKFTLSISPVGSENKFKLTNDKNGNFAIQSTYSGQLSGIITGSVTTGNTALFTDPNQSSYEYGLGVNLIRDKTGNLKPEKRTDGYLNFNIVEMKEE